MFGEDVACLIMFWEDVAWKKSSLRAISELFGSPKDLQTTIPKSALNWVKDIYEINTCSGVNSMEWYYWSIYMFQCLLEDEQFSS